MTIPFPLSACLMVMSGLCFRSLSALLSLVVRLWNLFLLGWLLSSSCFVLVRYSSSVGLDLGGSQVEGVLKGCFGFSGWFLKK